MASPSFSALADELILTGDEPAGAAMSSLSPRMEQPMKSPRRKGPKTAEGGSSLLPLLGSTYDNKLSELVEIIQPKRQRDELILNAQNIRTFLGLLEEFRHVDTLRRHGLGVRSKLLFCGPPGCGKTITAEVFARELGLPLLVARLDAIISSFLGETASNLRKVFDAVSNQPCVLFLDEFDALARARADGAEHNELRRVVNSLLMMIDRYHGRGFLIAATNLEESLDSAVWRRFDEVILFEPPHDRQIREMVRLKTRNFPSDFSIEKYLGKLRGLSYADIERVCLNAIKRSILKKSHRLLEQEFNLAIREERRRQEIRGRIKLETA